MVINGQVIIAGVFDYTGPATCLNDENVIILGDLGEAEPAAVAKQRRLPAARLLSHLPISLHSEIDPREKHPASSIQPCRWRDSIQYPVPSPSIRQLADSG